MTFFDVIIIGGGPAGATAGITLLGKGLKVLLIDKAKFPRRKICGGGLSIRTLDRFPFLSEPLNSIPVNYISKIYLQSPDHSELSEERDDPMYFMVKRGHFDNILLDICKNGDIEVLENSKLMTIDQSEGHLSLSTNTVKTLKTGIVIIADGLNSTAARHLGLHSGWSHAHKAVVMTGEADYGNKALTNKNTMYVFYGFGDTCGYGYVFPKSQSIDIGIGYLLEYYKKDGESLGKTYDRFFHFLKTNGFLSSDAQTTFPRSALLPIGGPLKKTYSDRVLLCGDAAGFVNAFTAEGIYYAMVTGEIAANTALDAINKNRYDEAFFSRYQERWYREIGDELTSSVRIQSSLFRNTKMINFIVREANQNDQLKRVFTDYSIGHLTSRSMSKSLLIRFLPFFVKYKLKKFFHWM